MEKQHLPVRACKLPWFMEISIGTRMEICVNSGLPIAMVPCLYQSNVYVKMKLMVWRAQKCISLVGAKTTPTCTGLQTTVVHGGQYRAENGNLRKFGSTYRHGTMFVPKQCLCQNEANGMESPKMHFTRRCKDHTYLYRLANYRGSWRAVQG